MNSHPATEGNNCLGKLSVTLGSARFDPGFNLSKQQSQMFDKGSRNPSGFAMFHAFIIASLASSCCFRLIRHISAVEIFHGNRITAVTSERQWHNPSARLYSCEDKRYERGHKQVSAKP